jgi:uncharacterized protein
MDGVKVVFHINEDHKWENVLKNIKYILEDDGVKSIVIEVVANEIAVAMFAAPEQLSEGCELGIIRELTEQGAIFTVCRKSLNALGINEEFLPDYLVIVPVGITELIAKQQQGYAYLKP